MADKHVVLNTPTGSGKSLVATALHFKALAEGKTSFYTCPVKALVSEKFFDLCRLFGAEQRRHDDGRRQHQPRRADHLLHRRDPRQHGAARRRDAASTYVVMDEFHYYADRERGMAWQVPLLALDATTLPADVGDAGRHARDRPRGCTRRPGARSPSCAAGSGRCRWSSSIARRRCTRPSTSWSKSGRAPIYLVNFTQRGRRRAGAEPDERRHLVARRRRRRSARRWTARRSTRRTARTSSASSATASASTTRGCCPSTGCWSRGWRRRGCSRSSAAPTRWASASTSRSAPCCSRSCASSTARRPAILGVREFQQIAGRAGRKGFDDRGYVVAQAPEHVIENRRLADEAGAGQEGGDAQAAARRATCTGTAAPSSGCSSGTPEPLESRFEVTHGVLLSCLQGGRDAGERRAAAATGGCCRSSRARTAATAPAARAAAPGRGLLPDAAPRGHHRRRPVRGGARARRRGQRRAAARLLAPPHAVAVPGRCARAARPRGADLRAGRADAGRSRSSRTRTSCCASSSIASRPRRWRR